MLKSLTWEKVDVLIEFLEDQLKTMKADKRMTTAEDVYKHLDNVVDYLKGLKEGNAT